MMKNTDENNNAGIFKPALNHALIISAALIILSLTLYLTGQLQNQYAGWISAAISLVGIIYAIYNYRNQQLGGFISFGRAVGYGVVVGLIVGIITGLFAFLLYGVISPELVDEARLYAERELYKANPDLDYDQAQVMLKVQYWFISPTGMLVAGIFGGALQGLIFGIIGGIFARRKDNNVL